MSANGEVLLLILILAFCASADATLCRFGYQEFTGSCYGPSDIELPWAEAQEMCQNFNSSLVVIENEEENTFVKYLARLIDDNVWVGATAPFDHRNWFWVGPFPYLPRPLEFSDWGSNQPNNFRGNQNCLFLYTYDDYTWHDEACSSYAYFICEYKLGP